ncbi:peptidoglycan bridge formation glycyltransferase FemA/FemB family protein [Candidatus Parcubacteria bacterium]|jgi:lipid II:glycine glycyltransferase (peptidoglycan interpeptide bridge formation enzyme)|nr:peptidoglycan bridge formation glycyltransferase FemA/FemB family protein [Candidatus Parcubacteria bacterium]
MYKVKQITDKNKWETFVKKQEYTLMNQSWKYGEFYKNLQENFWVFGVYEEDILIAGALVLSTHARRGDYLYLPYGPIITKDKENILKILTKNIAEFAKKEKYSFIRVSPFADATDEHKKLYKKMGYRKAPIHALAENTWLLDLTPSEDELLSAMNKNHRNLIRRCDREGIRIEKKTEIKDLDKLNELLDHTAKKHNFHRFPKKYIEEEFKPFKHDGEVCVYNAYLPDGTLDASAVIYFYGNMAAYRHSASLNLNRKLPSSYLIQWNVIQDAKKRGIKYYNFWGIAPDNADKKHPFFGITHFKKGFGGFNKDVLHAQDYIVSWKYWINWSIETLRRIKRGF